MALRGAWTEHEQTKSALRGISHTPIYLTIATQICRHKLMCVNVALICNLAFRRDFCSVTCSFGHIVATEFPIIYSFKLCLFIFFECSKNWVSIYIVRVSVYEINRIIRGRLEIWNLTSRVQFDLPCTCGSATRGRSNWQLEDKFHICARLYVLFSDMYLSWRLMIINICRRGIQSQIE